MQGGPSAQYLDIQTRSTGGGKEVEVSVSDSGPGVSLPIRERIFEPFFTTKPTGQGTGLGPKICSDIAAAHGGRITVGDAVRGGACFTVVLPATGLVPSVLAHSVVVNQASPEVLVVDDDLEVAKVLADILLQRGFKVQIALSGTEALKRIEVHRFTAVLSDMRMPGMDGMEFHTAIGLKFPDVLSRVGFITADATAPDIARYLRRTKALFVEKPFSAAAVEDLVARLVQPEGKDTL